MASQAEHESRSRSDCAAGETDASEIEEAAADGPHDLPERPEAGLVQDEELIALLEQLNETLDSARSALSEQHQLAALTVPVADAAQVEAHAPPPAETPPQGRALSPLKLLGAAGLGACIGAAALTLFGSIRLPAWLPLPQELAGDAPADDPAATMAREDADPPAKAIQERLSKPPRRVQAVLTVSRDLASAMAEENAAEAAMPAAAPDIFDKPDFDEKDEANSAPVPAPSPELAALPKQPAPVLVLTAEEEAAFMARGQDLLDHGDFASARLIFEHAATRGSAAAMFALGQSFDPRFLKQRDAVGIEPDVGRALDWYGRAAQQGHPQAEAMAEELEQQQARR